MKIPKSGDVVKGTYQGIHNDQREFSLRGFKDDIRIENKLSESKYLKNTKINDELDLLITKVDNDNFHIDGSISTLYESRAHETLKSLTKTEAVTAVVKSLNPAGYVMEILHDNVVLMGFMPNTLAGINKLYDPESILGDTFDVIIESFSNHEGTYIVSRKKYLQSLIPEEVKKLNYDDVYYGHVTGTTPFGVFVEFNDCLTGMIHKVNLNTQWQPKITEIDPGTPIEFYVKDIIKDKNNKHKIILTQILRESLWDTIKNGQLTIGKVRNIKPFGVLVSLDEETIGLIHSSEVERSNKTFKIGDDIPVKILAVDKSNRKIFLKPN